MFSKHVRSIGAATTPFRYRRPVRFGDTDAAGIVYTGNVSSMALEAIEVWFRERLKIDWYDNHRRAAVDSPCVHLQIDFRSPMTPRDVLDIAVLLERASGSSLQVRLIARSVVGSVLKWQSRFVFACVNLKTFRSTPIPKSWLSPCERELAITAGAGAMDNWTERAARRSASRAVRRSKSVASARA